MRSLSLLVAFTLSLAAAACGGGSSPTEPTPAPAAVTTPPASGATISGQISGATATASAAGVASARATPVSTIAVVGTSIATTAGSDGRFVLSGVPAGAVQLRFNGPGTDATLAVGELRTGDAVTLTVAVNGAHAALLEDSRSPTGSHTPINGIVSNLTGSVEQFEFVIDGRRIRGDAVTEFYGHPNVTPARVFEEMNGLRAEVKAWPRAGYWYAERLHVNLDDESPAPPTTPTTPTAPNETSASIEGSLTSITGSRPAVTLIVAGTTVRTDGSTVVQRRGDTQDLSVLQIGMTIHVVGDRRSDGSIDARRLQIKDDAAGAAFEIEGSVGGLKGTCPSLSFGIDGFDVATSGATAFTPGCGELRNGQRVRVRGTTQPNGSVLAASVTRA